MLHHRYAYPTIFEYTDDSVRVSFPTFPDAKRTATRRI